MIIIRILLESNVLLLAFNRFSKTLKEIERMFTIFSYQAISIHSFEMIYRDFRNENIFKKNIFL
jgi:hypothetical protein